MGAAYQEFRDRKERGAPGHEAFSLPSYDLGGRTIAQIEATELPPLIANGMLRSDDAMMLYGNGDVGKGTLACEWIRQLVLEGHRPLILDYEDHEREWKMRLDGLGLADPSAVHLLSPNNPNLWHGPKGGIAQQAEAIRAYVIDHGLTFIVIDSKGRSMPASDLNKNEAPEAYMQALSTIHLPSLTLDHTSGASTGDRSYGSVYWHNYMRLTFFLQKGGKLIVKKDNEYGRFGWTWQIEPTWWNGTLREVKIVRFNESVREKIDTVLADMDEYMTPKQIAGEYNKFKDEDAPDRLSESSVRSTLRREVGEHYVQQDGGYLLAARAQTLAEQLNPLATMVQL